MNDSSSEKGKIFVFGNYGEILKEKDAKRIHAIGQQNSHHYLSVIANQDAQEIVKAIIESDMELTDDVIKLIMDLNETHDIFVQFSKYMRIQGDMLSIGSFLTGEKESDKAFLKLFGD